MRFILVILLLCSIGAQGQIINASPFYKPYVSACSYLLDQYSGAAAAYSLRLLDCQYAGSAIRVRRSSDNTESDIGFVNGNLDTASLKAFVGTGGSDDGFVTVWYSQTGSNNISQSTAANQPLIIDNGVVVRYNNLPTIRFDGVTGINADFFNANSLTGISVLDIYMVHSTSDNSYIHFYNINNGASFSYVATSGSTNTLFRLDFGSPSLYTNNSLQSISNRGDAYTAMNGYKLIVMQGAATTASSNWGGNFKIGGYATGFEFSGNISEMIFYNSDKSESRTSIQSNINTYYSVY